MPRSARPAAVLLLVAAAFVGAVLLQRRGESPEPRANAQSPATPPDPAKFVIAPYLQFPTQTSVTVMWETAANGTAVVEYGPTAADLKRVEKQSEGPIHDVTIN